MYYIFRQDRNMNEFLDGRSIIYVSKQISLNREWVSLILRGRKKCSEEQAKLLVQCCCPTDTPIDLYFEVITKEGC